MKPIETKAYGCRFRSRLEARWAVFFTALDLNWEYEPEGYKIGNDFYLPDFRVYTPQGEPIWYEIKPQNVSQDQKFNSFLELLKASVPNDVYAPPRATLLNGDPCWCFTKSNSIHICPRCGHFRHFQENKYEWIDALKIIISCESCDAETVSGGGNPVESGGFLGLRYTPNKGWIEADYFTMIRIQEKIIRAGKKALSARFEHGESPE